MKSHLYDISPITLYKRGQAAENSWFNFSWQSFLIKGWKTIDLLSIALLPGLSSSFLKRFPCLPGNFSNVTLKHTTKALI